jgi:hypothetical protein
MSESTPDKPHSERQTFANEHSALMTVLALAKAGIEARAYRCEICRFWHLFVVEKGKAT